MVLRETLPQGKANQDGLVRVERELCPVAHCTLLAKGA